MKEIVANLQKVFESRVRLEIMSILMVNDSYEYNSFKEILQVTDGNLASHLKTLEKKGLIKVNKQFIGKKPNTSYSATPSGTKLFRQHLDALERIIKQK
ncbi:MAG TPA: transcriptional regulator [Bacteroidales bacterium]|nr:transcriptional regulator [Bacteroidales bacterium]HPT20607.1 transcriptional regulator [Bacteroidales bacterium]